MQCYYTPAAPVSTIKIMYFIYQLIISMFNQYKKVLKRYVNFFGTKLLCILHTQPIWKWANHISSAYYPHLACGHHIIRSSSHLLRHLREGWEHPGTAPRIWQHGALCCGPQGNGTNTCEPLLSPRRDGVHFSDCGTSPSQQPVHGRGCPSPFYWWWTRPE